MESMIHDSVGQDKFSRFLKVPSKTSCVVPESVPVPFKIQLATLRAETCN